MQHYYNDIEPFACEWLHALMNDGQIPQGVIDGISIRDIAAEEVRGFVQCHYFAGIGGWPLALRLAGWPEDRPVWTGSCPCQPFSQAGKGKGVNDARHLWPDFCKLIAQCRPPTVLGEQVASKDGRVWLAGVRADLEALGYRFGAADLCAAGIGAPHIRQRLFWGASLGVSNPTRGGLPVVRGTSIEGCKRHPDISRATDVRLADTQRDGGREHQPERGQEGGIVDRGVGAGLSGLVHTHGERGCSREPRAEDAKNAGLSVQVGLGEWGDYYIVSCADGKARRLKPGLAPLVDGVPRRVGLLRGYGNAIVPHLAAEFVQAFLEAEGGLINA